MRRVIRYKTILLPAEWGLKCLNQKRNQNYKKETSYVCQMRNRII